MKSLPIVCIVLLLAGVRSFGEEKYRGGIVYGPKAAFNISAPEGWVLDNEAGAEQGLPFSRSRAPSSWSDARTIMYAKIASTQYEDIDKFVAIAIKEMKDRHGLPKQKIESGKTGDGKPYFINEYPATKNYSQWERVAYIQLPHAVAYVVLSSRDEPSYRKDAPALTEVLKTFVYLEPKSDRGQH